MLHKVIYNMLSIGSHESNAVLQWSCGAFAHLTSYILHTVILLYDYIQYTTQVYTYIDTHM